ncbi:hypothetical protein [Saccharibacillus qingshengii]|uniref:hypothetical protein n=1 Tax=Saccharibacillus qingshengii TaxID=1763540 RepID=UPI00155751A6|nr:hypothetical protein [Saccharibacillus qingshengii]
MKNIKKAIAASAFAAVAAVAVAAPASADSISSVSPINYQSLQSMDLESALMAVQEQRAQQLKDQLNSVRERNVQSAILNSQLADAQNNGTSTPQDIANLQAQIDALNNAQQMDMLRLQSLSNKRNEAFDLMTNFMKKMQDSRSSIIGNMR